jgi:N-acyl-D-amino-acid deacylase
MDDLLIRGAEVIDGTGAPGRRVDVAVRDGRISAVGGPAGPARRIIDGAGAVLAPGFIDIHTHSDFTLPLNQRA